MVASAPSADLFEVIFFVVLGIVHAAVISTAVFAVLMRRGAGPPACGVCHYAVEGLTSFDCPECGVDLRKAGITTQRPIKRAFTIALAAGLGVAFLVILTGAWLSL